MGLHMPSSVTPFALQQSPGGWSRLKQKQKTPPHTVPCLQYVPLFLTLFEKHLFYLEVIAFQSLASLISYQESEANKKDLPSEPGKATEHNV